MRRWFHDLNRVNGPAVGEVLEVARVWSAHPVGFALYTAAPYQYVAYYDHERRMTVAARRLGERSWQTCVLPERVGWDSHNYVTLAVDVRGHLHVAGNMHVTPLVYFRSERPHDVSSLVRVPHMVGSEEQRVTYPRFLRGPGGELIFTYRDGSSGSGNEIYNIYDPYDGADGGGRWRRLLDAPLIDGEGRMNAYVEGPLPGPDGFYHMAWIWRDTPDAATNHDVSYARSRDLVHWERSDGTPYELPITFGSAEIVDPVPPFGGAINNNVKIGFDSRNRAVISYHKFDGNGVTQCYHARREEGGWRIRQGSRWEYRWKFGGGGSIPFEIRLGPVRPGAPGRLVHTCWHIEYGDVSAELDEETLELIGAREAPPRYPVSLLAPASTFPGMEVQWAEDLGTGPVGVVVAGPVADTGLDTAADTGTEPRMYGAGPGTGSGGEAGVEPRTTPDADRGARYVLRWESLQPHRDRPRSGELPPPSWLRVVEVLDTEK